MKTSGLIIFFTTTLVSSTLVHPRAFPAPAPLPEALASPEAFPDTEAIPYPVPGLPAEWGTHTSSGMESRPPLARVITRCTSPNAVALTFDDGPYIYQGGECIAYLLGITTDTDQT